MGRDSNTAVTSEGMKKENIGVMNMVEMVIKVKTILWEEIKPWQRGLDLMRKRSSANQRICVF